MPSFNVCILETVAWRLFMQIFVHALMYCIRQFFFSRATLLVSSSQNAIGLFAAIFLKKNLKPKGLEEVEPLLTLML